MIKKKYLTKCIRVSPDSEETPNWILPGTTTETYDGYVSLSELEQAIEDTCNEFDQQGYDVISIIPLIRGNWDSELAVDGAAGWGYSVTDGVAITAKRR